MTEYIDIYTKDHIRTGRRVPRTAHLKIGEYRLIVHVCLFNAENKMLIQKRSSRKTSFGGFWDVSSGGHSKAGETSTVAIHRELLEELGDYPGAAEKITEAREAQYAKALEATYACRMDEAIALWNELGDYRDGRTLRDRCLARVAAMAAGTDEPIRASEYSGKDLGGGTLYWVRLGLVYVPKDAGPQTRCMIFWPGGYDEALANSYLSEYANSPNLPNALMLLCYANGYSDPVEKIEDCYRTLEQAGIENNVFLHDLVLCGASMGAYTACQGAAELYRDHGLAARCVLTFDAGNHWEEPSRIMTPEQCDLAAEAGTSFKLLEFGGIGMNKRAIELMVAHGDDVTIVEVAEGGHYSIITDAMRAGMIDWALGVGERPDNGNYKYIPLDRNSTYPRGQS